MQKEGGKICLILALILISGFFCVQNANAEVKSVIISEIAWMGTENSATDEWIELENTTDRNIDLAGWTLRAEDGSPEIELSGIVPAKGFFLLERSDDESVPNISADLIYSGSLGNTGEILELFNDDDNLVDKVEAIDVWPAGDNDTKETMQFSNSGWVTAEPTPKKKNYESLILEQEENAPVIDNDSGGGSVTIKKIEKIIINEIYPNPVGSDRQKE